MFESFLEVEALISNYVRVSLGTSSIQDKKGTNLTDKP